MTNDEANSNDEMKEGEGAKDLGAAWPQPKSHAAKVSRNGATRELPRKTPTTRKENVGEAQVALMNGDVGRLRSCHKNETMRDCRTMTSVKGEVVERRVVEGGGMTNDEADPKVE